jgi:hypothetical protein
MSGIEVVGIVLGAVPLVISALEHYSDGVSSIKRAIRYKIELEKLMQDLEAEYCIYQDTTEYLLRDLLDENELGVLLDDLQNYPICGAWKNDDMDLESKLKQRLGRSYGAYMRAVAQMNDVVTEFKKRLDLDNNGKVSNRTPSCAACYRNTI